MKKISITLIFTIVFLIHALAQEKELHLLMAYPFQSFDSMDGIMDYSFSKYNRILFRVENDSLVIVDTLNTPNTTNMPKIFHFPDKKFFYFEEENKKLRTSSNFFSILDYENELIIRRYNSDLDMEYNEHTPFPEVLIKDSVVVIQNEINASSLYPTYGIDRYFNKYEIHLKDYQNVYKYGISGRQEDFYFTFDYAYGNFSKLKVAKIKNYDDMPDAWIQLPEKFKPHKDPYVHVRINNEKYFVGTGDNRYMDPKAKTKLMWVFDKRTELWDTIRIPGTKGYLRNWNDWFYGTVENSTYFFFKEKENISIIIDAEKKKIRYKYNLNNGDAPFLEGKTGKLFLFHIPTKKLIEWNTGDKDSEIIQVIDGKIYFRVYDELRCMDIDETHRDIDIKSETVLIKNKDVIPYVHWIFFAPKMKLREIWVNDPSILDTMKIELGELYNAPNLNGNPEKVWIKYHHRPELRKNKEFIKYYSEYYDSKIRNSSPFIGIFGGYLNKKIEDMTGQMYIGVTTFYELQKETVRPKEGTELQEMANEFYVGTIEFQFKSKWTHASKTVLFPKDWSEEKIREEIILAGINPKKKLIKPKWYKSEFTDGTPVLLGPHRACIPLVSEIKKK